MSNKVDNLDLYGKLESLIPFTDEIEGLYRAFLDEVKDKGGKKVLDVGCGNGKFAKLLADNGFDVKAIDLSPVMIERAKKVHSNSYVQDICDETEKYDVITAVFDVLNYLDKKTLTNFLSCISNTLKDDGHFIADINSLHGFEDIAQGSLILEGKNSYGSIYSEFEDGKLITDLRMFEKEGELYRKSEERIIQHYHDEPFFANLKDLELFEYKKIALFSEDGDKELLVFKRK
ncbi:MAG: class I SAM-dependent methyltransferase [Campylobacterales bacterium]|nr:class I SAM-dependent methyltransferase [Campylobacterales bacterium]